MSPAQAREATERDLQQEERRTLRDITAGVALLLLLHRKRRSGIDVESLLIAGLPLVLERSRSRTVATAVKSIEREARALKLPRLPEHKPRRQRQRRRFKRIAKHLGKRWAHAFEVSRGSGKSDRAAAKAATAATRWNLQTVATTEASTAFTEARNDYARELAEQGYALDLRWVAELDACKRCWALDGDTMDALEGWSTAPGSIHPNCRCYDVVERRES